MVWGYLPKKYFLAGYSLKKDTDPQRWFQISAGVNDPEETNQDFTISLLNDQGFLKRFQWGHWPTEIRIRLSRRIRLHMQNGFRP
jgi:hypothetical protein